WNRLPGPRSAPGLRAAPRPGRLVRRLPPRHRRRPHHPAALHRAGDSAGESRDQPVHPGRSPGHRALGGDAAHRLARGAGPRRAPPPPGRRPRLGPLSHGQGTAADRTIAAPGARSGPPLRRAHQPERAPRAAALARQAGYLRGGRMHTRRKLLGAAALGLVGGAIPFTLRAQGIDTAKIIVGFPPGGTTDVMARKVADKLRGPYARVSIVENRPGAGGQLGVVALKDSPADGSTMLLTPSSMLTIYPHTYRTLQYKLED